MAFQLVLEFEIIPHATVKLDIGISRDSQRLPVSREGMVGDGMVKEVMHFRAGHIAGWNGI